MSAIPVYPVRLEGRLDAPINRWLWLVKWLLVIPHLIVLAFLWVAFVVLSIGAFFAIVFTGRYPRAIFDFNVGVLRWTWRVGFYSYSALGTDRYPPFSLGEEPDYPATLEVAYPEHLSRGLALVKWWLLAIPHYLIVGVFVGGAYYATRDAFPAAWDGGLITLLVVIAGFALLFTARYPRGIFDLVLGLNRWAVRVAGYAALMTDVYPPFRLDMGGSEPGAIEMARPQPAPQAPPSEPTIGVGRIAGSIVASLLCLVGVGAVLAGGALVVIDTTQRDADGYVMSPSERFSTSAYAIETDRINIPVDGPDRLAQELLGNVRIKSDSSSNVFVGIGRESDVDAYLRGVERETVRDFWGRHDSSRASGSAPAGSPADQRFWAATASGSGRQALDWKVRDGDWVAVLMNADGSRAVDAKIRIGAELDNLGWIGTGILGGGLVLLALGATGLYLAVAARRIG